VTKKVKEKIKWVNTVLIRVLNIVTYMGGRLQNAPTSAWIVRVGQKGRGIGQRMVSEQFITNFKSGSKSASNNSQMVSDLIRVRNRIRTSIRWPQMTKW
jgi:hypothetical protein